MQVQYLNIGVDQQIYQQQSQQSERRGKENPKWQYANNTELKTKSVNTEIYYNYYWNLRPPPHTRRAPPLHTVSAPGAFLTQNTASLGTPAPIRALSTSSAPLRPTSNLWNVEFGEPRFDLDVVFT
jgi:hypothetical protein